MPTEEMDLHIRRASLVPKNEHSQYTWTTEEDEMRDMLAAGDMREDTTAQPTEEELTQMLEIKQEMDTDMSLSGTFFWGCYRSITVRHCMSTCKQTLHNT